MEFTSFEEALRVCLTAADNSPEQEAALAHCLATAPPDLRALLAARGWVAGEPGDHAGGCGCGCRGKAA